jgi:hypothetical protein
MDLITACRYGNPREVKWCLEEGADVNYTCFDGFTGLFWAIDRQNFDMCRLLLDHGADVNKKNQYNHTPLMYAVFNSKIDIIKLLLIRGANVNYKNKFGSTSLDYVSYDDYNIAKILCWRGAESGQNKKRNKKIREIDTFLLLVHRQAIPLDLLREIHTKWIS